MRNVLILAIAAALGCLYERPYVAAEPAVPAPPPPPADTQAEYQAEAQPPPPAGSEIADEDVFYGGLSPYGTWTVVAPYGRVWIPAVGYGWRPYYYGRWVLTDWGWTFVSDDPWGWAAYHYGRWNFAMGLGWYWIPGRVWGPAWVSWRYGGGYAAWCPLGPQGVIFGYRHPAWVAVPEQHFTQPIPRAAVPTQATSGIVTSRTQPLAGPRATPAHNGAFGPPVAGIQRATGQTVPRVAAAQVIRPRPVAGTPAPIRTANDPMRSPAQPRARAGSGGDVPRSTAPVARPGEVAPRQPYTGAPRSGAPRSGQPAARPGASGAPRGGAAAPRSGGAKPSAPATPAPKARARDSDKK
ncbi:MAG: DUF6600 domain-containing protein [Myxococcales bacterium]